MDGATNASWLECYARYELLKNRDQWNTLAQAMIKLIDRIRADASFPDTIHFVSHAWLRIGPPSTEPNYRPTVWVGWRKPNYYWIGVGSFGTRNRITVSSDKVVPMLKRYLKNLAQLDPTYSEYAELPPEPVDPWTKTAVEARYQGLPNNQIAATLVEDITAQTRDIRDYVEQLHEAVAGLEQIVGADQAIEAILRRIDRITDLMNTGTARWRASDTPPKATLAASEADAAPSDHTVVPSSPSNNGLNGTEVELHERSGNGAGAGATSNGASVGVGVSIVPSETTSNGSTPNGVAPNRLTAAANLKRDESA